MQDKKNEKINAEIAGRIYPVIVDQKEQQSIQTIVQNVNEKIGQFKVSYPRKDNQDYLAMAILSYAVDKQQSEIESQNTTKKHLAQRINKIDQMLDELIAS